MQEIIEDMSNLCDGITTMTEYVLEVYGEFSDEYDYVVRLDQFAQVILGDMKKKVQ